MCSGQRGHGSEGWSDGAPYPGFVVTTPFGARGDRWICSQVNGKGLHIGDDYSTNHRVGFPVHATAGGKVVVVSPGASGWGEPFGPHVVIQTRDCRHRYCHLSKALVSVGQRVQTRQEIGLSGNSGSNTTAPHLHYEERDPPFKFCADPARPT